MTGLKKITKKMKEVFNKIKLALISVFGSLLGFLLKHGEIAVKVTNIFKEVVENPAINWAVAFTPNKTDDLLLAKAKVLAPKIALKVGLAMNIVTVVDVEKDPDLATAKILGYIRDILPNEGRGIFYRELSGELAEAIIEAKADGVVSRAEWIAIVQLLFKKRI